MKEIYQRTVRSLRPMIIRSLTSDDLASVIDHFISEDHLTTNQEEHIMHEVTTDDKVRHFLKYLMTGSDKAFECFVQVLRDIGDRYSDVLKEIDARIKQKKSLRIRENSVTEIGNVLNDGGVPQRAAVLIDRPEMVKPILKALEDISDGTGWVLVHGMGGIGKSMLAAEALHSDDILKWFPGGVLWVSLGHLEEDRSRVFVKLKTLLGRLDPQGRGPTPTNEEEAQHRIRHILHTGRPPTLLVLDDCWTVETAKSFDVGGYILVTSRDSNVLDRVQGNVKKVFIIEGFSKEQSNLVLSRCLNKGVSELPKEAADLHEKVAGMPLAISMLGALLRDNPNRWGYYLEMLKRRQFKRLKKATTYEYETLYEAIAISIDQLDKEYLEKYEDLAVFDDDSLLSGEVLSIYWDEDVEMAEDVMNDLVGKSLAYREWSTTRNCYLYGIHDLQLDILKERRKANLKVLHLKLVSRYEKHCNYKWDRLRVTDSYIWWAIAYHLNRGGDNEKMVSLYTNLSFLEAKLKVTGPSDVINDFYKYKAVFERCGKASERESYCTFIKTHAHRFSSNLDEDSMPSAEDDSIVARPASGNWSESSSHSGSRTNSPMFYLLDRDSEVKSNFPDLIQLGLCQPHGCAVYKDALERARLSGQFYWEWSNRGMAMHHSVWSARVTGSVWTSDISPDGSRVLVGSGNGRITLLDSTTGQEVFSLLAHKKSVNDCEFDAEGKRIITCGEDGDLSLWRIPDFALQPGVRVVDRSSGEGDGPTPTPQIVEHCWLSMPQSIRKRRLSAPDSLDDMDTAEEATVEQNCFLSKLHVDMKIMCCAISHDFLDDQTFIVAGLDDGTVVKCTIVSDRIYKSHDIKAHNDAVTCLCLSQKDDLFASSSMDGSVRVYSFDEMDFLSQYWGHGAPERPGQPLACVFLPPAIIESGGPLISSCSGANIHVWNFKTKELVKTFSDDNSRRIIQAMSFSDDGRFLAAGTTDSTVKVWVYATGQLLAQFYGHTSWVLSVGFILARRCSLARSGSSPSSSLHRRSSIDSMISSSIGSDFDRMSLTTPTPTPPPPGATPTRRNWLMSGSDDGTVMVWDISSFMREALQQRRPSMKQSTKLSLHHRFETWMGSDGRLLVLGQDKNLCLKFVVSDASGESYFQFEPSYSTDEDLIVCGPESSQACAFAISPSAERAAVGFKNGFVKIYDLKWTGDSQLSNVHFVGESTWHKTRVRCIFFIPPPGQQKRDWLVSADDSGFVKIWQPCDSDALLSWRAHEGSIAHCRHLSKRNHLLSASGGCVRLWTMPSCDSGQIKGELLKPVVEIVAHENSILSLDVNQDETVVATGSVDKAAKVWCLTDGVLLFSLSDHSDCVRVCRFCPGHKNILATGDDSGHVRLWRLWKTHMKISGSSVRCTLLTTDAERANSWVNDLAWTSDGRLISVSDNIRVWHVDFARLESDRAQYILDPPLRTFYIHGGLVQRIRVDTRWLVTVDLAGTFYVLRRV